MVFKSTTAKPDDTYSFSSFSPRSQQKQNPTAATAAKQESRNSEHPQQHRQPAAAASSSPTREEREDVGIRSSPPPPAPTNSNTNTSVAAYVAAIEAAHKKKLQKADITSKVVVQDRKINQLLCHQRTRTKGNTNTTSLPTAPRVVPKEKRREKTSKLEDSSPLPAQATLMPGRKTQDQHVKTNQKQKISSNKESNQQQCLSTMTAPTISMTSSIAASSSSSSLLDGSAARMATASSPSTMIGRPTPADAATAVPLTTTATSTTTTTRAPRSRLGVPGATAGWRATHKNRTTEEETPPCTPPAVAKKDEIVGGKEQSDFEREEDKLETTRHDEQNGHPVMVTATRSIRTSSSSSSAVSRTPLPNHTNTHTVNKRRLADVREHRRQRYLLRMIAQQQQQQQQHDRVGNQQGQQQQGKTVQLKQEQQQQQHDREGNQQGRQQKGKTGPQQQQQQQQQQQPSDEETTEDDPDVQARTMTKTISSKTSIDRRDTIPRTSTCTSKDTTVAIKNKKQRDIHKKKRNGNPPGLVRQNTEDFVDMRSSTRNTTTTSNPCHFQDHMLLLQTTDTEEWVGTTASLQCEAITQHMLHFIRDDTQDRTEDYHTPDEDDDDDGDYSPHHQHTKERSQQDFDSLFERIDHATARSSAVLTQDGQPPRPPTPPRRWRPPPPHHDAADPTAATATVTSNPTRHSNRIKLHIYDLITHETRIDLWGLYHFPLGAVFNVVNSSLHSIGTGVYHVGVEVDSLEYAYGANSEDGLTGIFICPPTESPSYQYRTTIDFGDVVLPTESRTRSGATNNTRNTTRTSRKILDRMSHEYLGTEYDLLRKNCCTFAYDLCVRLGVNEHDIPSWFHNLSSVVWSETTKPSS